MSANSSTSAPWTFSVQCLKKYAKWLAYGQVLLFSILFLNGPIIIVLVRKIRRLSAGNIIILHLSFADFLLSLAAVFNNFFLLAGSPLASIFFCQLTAFLARFTHSSSIYLITIMAACRCYSVIKPFQYRLNVLPSRINKICFGAWCLSLVLAMMPLMGWGEYEPASGRCACWLDTHKYPYNWLVYCLIGHVIPVIINSVCISTTAKKITKQKKVRKAMRMRRRSRFKPALFKKTSEINPKDLGNASALQACESRRNIKSTVVKTTVKVEIHRGNSSDSEDSPPILMKTAGEKIRVYQGEERSTSIDNDCKSEGEDNMGLTEVDGLKVNLGMMESHPKQGSKPHPEPTGNENKSHLQNIVQVKREKGENDGENVMKILSDDRQGFQPHLAVSLHGPNTDLKTCNENQTHLESIVHDERSKGENSEENLETTETQQKACQQHLESRTRQHYSDKNQEHLESIGCQKSIAQKERNKGEDEENQLKAESICFQGSQARQETINHHQRNRKIQGKRASKDFPILTIALVFASFVILCSPSAIVRSWYALAPDSVPQNAFAVVNFLAVVNSLVNPILYGLISAEIRSDVKKLFSCRL